LIAPQGAELLLEAEGPGSDEAIHSLENLVAAEAPGMTLRRFGE
jgi:hypothetical protein